MATGAIIGSLIAGATATGASAYQSHKANKQAKKEYKRQQNELNLQKQDALKKRKAQIDELRYNLLGDEDNSNNSINTNNSLINNDVILG